MADQPEPDQEPDEHTDYEKFEELTRKLVAVPKSEVDKERERTTRQ